MVGNELQGLWKSFQKVFFCPRWYFPVLKHKHVNKYILGWNLFSKIYGEVNGCHSLMEILTSGLNIGLELLSVFNYSHISYNYKASSWHFWRYICTVELLFGGLPKEVQEKSRDDPGLLVIWTKNWNKVGH